MNIANQQVRQRNMDDRGQQDASGNEATRANQTNNALNSPAPTSPNGSSLNGREHPKGLQPETRKDILRALEKSSVYREFAHDFTLSTGLPVSLTPVESWQLAHRDETGKSPFCALLAQHSHACAACLRTQRQVAETATLSARTVDCVHGLTETAIPVRSGEHLFGFVRTGQVFRRAPTASAFGDVLKRLSGWNVTFDTRKLRAAYFDTRVVEPMQYRSHVGLLKFLAQHLSLLSNQIWLQQIHVENPLVAHAKQFIEEHYTQPLTLHRVADAVHTSACHFCKVFKRTTGVNLTVYLSRLRVEKAKALMLNPHFRISEIAYAAGYGSLTHFNRMFKRATGFKPTEYRARLAHGLNGHAPGKPDHAAKRVTT